MRLAAETRAPSAAAAARSAGFATTAEQRGHGEQLAA
jgi:hypothetical protein